MRRLMSMTPHSMVTSIMVRLAPMRGPGSAASWGRTMATDSDARDEIIGLIYDAAVQPSLWPQAIARLADDVRCAAGGVVLYDLDGNPADLVVQARLDPHYLK